MELLLPSFSTIFSFFMFLFMLVKIFKKITKPRNLAYTLPPGPWKLPFVGNMHQLLGSLPHQVFRDLANKYGPFMYLKIGQVPTIVVSSPEFAKEVMRTHDTIFASRPQTLFANIMLYGCTDIAFSPYGEYWRQLRKICMQELLNIARVQSFRPIREQELLNLMEWIASNVGLGINLSERIHKSTHGITSRAAFGTKSKDHDEFISIMEESLTFAAGFEFTDLFPSLNFIDLISPARSKLEKLKQRAERIIEC